MDSEVKIGTLYEIRVPTQMDTIKVVLVTDIVPRGPKDGAETFDYHVLLKEKVLVIEGQTDEFFFSWFKEV